MPTRRPPRLPASVPPRPASACPSTAQRCFGLSQPDPAHPVASVGAGCAELLRANAAPRDPAAPLSGWFVRA